MQISLPLEHTMDGIDHVRLTIIINTVIEILKRTPFPWFSKYSDKLNRCASFIGAALLAGGIEFKEYSLVAGGTITIPPIEHVISGLISAATQAGSNEFFYVTFRAMKSLLKVGAVLDKEIPPPDQPDDSQPAPHPRPLGTSSTLGLDKR